MTDNGPRCSVVKAPIHFQAPRGAPVVRWESAQEAKEYTKPGTLGADMKTL